MWQRTEINTTRCKRSLSTCIYLKNCFPFSRLVLFIIITTVYIITKHQIKRHCFFIIADNCVPPARKVSSPRQVNSSEGPVVLHYFQLPTQTISFHTVSVVMVLVTNLANGNTQQICLLFVLYSSVAQQYFITVTFSCITAFSYVWRFISVQHY